MGNEVEARTQRVRDHLQPPDHSDWQLTNARIRSTVYLTAPVAPICTQEWYVRGDRYPVLTEHAAREAILRKLCARPPFGRTLAWQRTHLAGRDRRAGPQWPYRPPGSGSSDQCGLVIASNSALRMR